MNLTGDRQELSAGTRVLIVARNLYLGAGGMERTAVNLANHLAGRGMHVAAAYRENSGADPLYPLRADVVHLSCDFTGEALAETARKFDPAVIVFFYATWAEAQAAAALADTGIPFVLHEGTNPHRAIHTNWAATRGISPQDAALQRLALMSMCTRIRFTLADYRDSLPEPLRSDSRAFPNAFAPASQVDIDRRDRQKRKYFLNIGGLKRVKNVMAAVEAFGQIAHLIPEWDFHIFSANPSNFDADVQIERFLGRSGLSDRLKVFPPTAEIGREYGRSHVHIIASKEEGLPNCVAEASRHGLPSIGFSCCPGTNSLIVHERNGLLAQCGENEIEDLARQMLRLARNNAERQALGQAALEESSMFEPETVFAHWRSLLADAAGDRPGRRALLTRHHPEPRDAKRIRLVQRTTFKSQPFSCTLEMPSRPRLSFVVPIYDKEAYLDATLSSIRDNDYPDKEVVLVDDASTDGSLWIADRFAQENGWTVVRHGRNQGVSAARNTGLSHATGDIVQFWDADDIYDPKGVTSVIDVMQRHGSDIATGLATRDGEVLESYRSAQQNLDPTSFTSAPEIFATASVCFKLYRRSFLEQHDLKFVPDLYMQDFEFNLRAFSLAETISVTPFPIGEYLEIEGSGARTFHARSFASALQIEDMTRSFYEDHGLGDLDGHRQAHVLNAVWPAFIRRAAKNFELIRRDMPQEEIDIGFLDEVRLRLQNMESGLLEAKLPNVGLHLALFAIRSGYYHWVSQLVVKRWPKGFKPRLLGRNGPEHRLIDRLSGQLAR